MFDNIKPIDKQWERRKKQIWIGIAVFIVVAPILFYEFKNWREERVASQFFQTLEEQRYDEAYRLWNPAPSYTKADFMGDWGDKSPYGKINEFKITHSHAMGSGVKITAQLNGKEALLWVESKNHSLGFPPY